MENFVILGLKAGIKCKGLDAGIKKISEIHLTDESINSDFYISMAVIDDKVCIYDTDNTTYHIQVNDGTEIPCENFDDILQSCCTIETTRQAIIENSNSAWFNLFRFLLKATESNNPEVLVYPYLKKKIAELPAKQKGK